VNGQTTSNHEGLVLAFERAAEGATDSEVAEALNVAGYRPSPHARRARFAREAVRTILANRFYVGELPIGKRGAGGWIKGAHEPLVPVVIFEAVQSQRTRRATNPNASADAAQRNRLVRALFEAVHVQDRHLVSVRRRPEFQPYLVLTEAETPSLPQQERRCLGEERGGGLEGIRTPGLGLDRAAC
jgi:Recombinase